MQPIPPLADLGPRIAILGPSNAGKSTLAVAIGRRLGIPAVHLDRFSHLPGTDWQPRPEAELAALHASAIAEESWVMDGNYSRLFPQRFARATGAVVLGSNRWRRFARYLTRTLSGAPRAGDLPGGTERVNWEMVHWVLAAPRNTADYVADIRASGLPHVIAIRQAELDALYRAWALTR